MKKINYKNKNHTPLSRSTLRVPRYASFGFTLVETLVAVAIFSIALTAIISVSARGITYSTNVKNRITASYLAQEYIDYMRALRQALVTQGVWGDFAMPIFGDCSTTDGCVIPFPQDDTYPPPMPIPCGSFLCGNYNMYKSSPNGFMYSATNPLSTSDVELPFKRYFTVSSNIDSLTVNVFVYWTDKNQTQTLTLSETLMNWIPQ